MAVQEKFYTAGDLWELSHSAEYADMHLELSEGELIVMTPAGGEHGEATFQLGRYIGNFVYDNDLGRCTAAETGYILHKNPNGRDVVRAPDVGFVKKERALDGFPKNYIPLAPDLAVEVVSPNDEAQDIDKKVQEYLRYGTRLVWVVYPATKSVMVYTLDSIFRLILDDSLDGGDVLPGFSLPLKKIFG